MMRRAIFLIGLMLSLGAAAQEQFTLEECYNLAKKAYPLTQQTGLLREKSNYDLAEIKKGTLPQLSLNGKATYQTEVIKIPSQTSGSNIEGPNKDQYQATLDVDQLIYNGNSISKRSALIKAETETDQQQVEVSLYTLKNRVNQYYFNALLLQEQTDMLEAKIEQLKASLNEMASAVKFGTVLRSEKEVLQAEILSTQQELTSIIKDKETALNQLSALILTKIETSARLEKPQISVSPLTISQRPELKYYDLKKEEFTQSQMVVGTENYPRLSGFAQAGYGNPGLDMLNNSFQDFYMLGVRLKWNLFDWGTTRDRKQALEISKEIMTTEKETFVLNNSIELGQALNDIEKYRALFESDQEIVDLRQSIVASSQSQLTNGVITASEFLTEFNKLYTVGINQKLHELQLELSKANYRVVQGYIEQ